MPYRFPLSELANVFPMGQRLNKYQTERLLLDTLFAGDIGDWMSPRDKVERRRERADEVRLHLEAMVNLGIIEHDDTTDTYVRPYHRNTLRFHVMDPTTGDIPTDGVPLDELPDAVTRLRSNARANDPKSREIDALRRTLEETTRRLAQLERS